MSEPRKKDVVHLARTLRWSAEKPAGSGWYWHRGTYRDPDPIIVEVDEAGYFHWPDGSFDDVHVISGEWAGPIAIPDEDV